MSKQPLSERAEELDRAKAQQGPPVTREHRAKAFACTWTDQPRRLELEWIEDGSHESDAGQRAVRTAKALAAEGHESMAAFARKLLAEAADQRLSGVADSVILDGVLDVLRKAGR